MSEHLVECGLIFYFRLNILGLLLQKLQMLLSTVPSGCCFKLKCSIHGAEQHLLVHLHHVVKPVATLNDALGQRVPQNEINQCLTSYFSSD